MAHSQAPLSGRSNWSSIRQMHQEQDNPVLSRYRDEQDKALQDLDAVKKEIALLRDRVLALELAVRDPVLESVSKRSDKAIYSSTEEDKEALHTKTADDTKPLESTLASIKPLGETTVSTEKVPPRPMLLLKTSSSTTSKPVKASLSATPEPVKSSPPPSTTTKSWVKASSSVTPKPEKSPPPLSTTTKSRVKASSSATPKPEKPSCRPSTCALGLSNPSTSDQQSSSVEPPRETNVSTANMPKSRAQLSKASSSATPKLEKPSPRPSTRELSLLNSSDQQSSPNVSTTKIPKGRAQLSKASSSATLKLEKHSPPPSTRALSLSSSSPDQQSSPVLTTSPSSRPLTTIKHLEALMKAARGGDNSSLTSIKSFCGTAHETPRNQRTELQRYALLHWSNRSPSVPSSVPNSVPNSGLGTVHTTLDDGMFSTEIHVDSSAWGIGFVMDGMWLAWKFSDSLAPSGNSIDNNWAEMLAVEVGLWTVIHWVRNVIQKEGDVIKFEVVVCSDNAGVVQSIEKRHSNFPPQQDILLRILDMVRKHDIQLSTRWISSPKNLADRPSRGRRRPALDPLPLIPPLPSHLSDTLLLSCTETC